MEPNLEAPDLEFLVLGISGPFNEQDLAESPLNRLGTGRTLDALGSMLERNILSRHRDGFAVSDAVRDHLWNHDTPLHTRLVRLLEIAPLDIPRIKLYLHEEDIESTLRSLQEEGAIHSYPMLQNGVPVPIYQAGRAIKNYNTEISDIIHKIEALGADPARTKPILNRLRRLAEHLDAETPDRGSAPK